MNKIKKILAPTDISELSKVGVRWALEIAKSDGAEVIVYHVVRHPILFHDDDFSPDMTLPVIDEIVEERKKLLEEYLKGHFADLTPGLKISIVVEMGIPYRVILDKAEKEKADLIVMSTHGRTGLIHMLIGSVTERVVREAICPVLSIRPVEAAKAAKATA
jgi:nucleotide-binding universal stress UspA family protein